MSQTTTTTNELHDKVFIFKVFNNPGLLESLKSINQHQVYLDLKNFCSEEIKVYVFYMISVVNSFLKLQNMLLFIKVCSKTVNVLFNNKLKI